MLRASPPRGHVRSTPLQRCMHGGAPHTPVNPHPGFPALLGRGAQMLPCHVQAPGTPAVTVSLCVPLASPILT